MRLASRLVLATCLLQTASAWSAEPATVLPPKTFDVKAIDEYLAKHVKAKGFVGLSVAIMKDGKVVLAKGYGKSSLKNGTDVDVDTTFAAGSVTKQFTCASILLLGEEGRLSIQKDKLAKYYPGLTSAGDVSLYDLMSHVSGYPDYYPLDFVDRRMLKPIDPDKLIQEYAGGKLDFAPGTRYSYSNTGYVILGRVVEKVSGRPFASFVQKRIFKPLGMKQSSLEPEPNDKRATGYTSFMLGDVEPATPEADGWILAAGGLSTTPSDLLKWDLALMEGKVLGPTSYQHVTTPRKLADGRTVNYGCGLGVAQREGETILRHSGAVSGFLAYNTMLPRTKSALALMTNSEHVDAGGLNDVLLDLLFRANATRTPQVPKVRGPAAKEAALDMLHQLQSGKVQRDNLGEEYSIFLSPKRVEDAKERLKALGEPEKVELEGTAERGGMEVASIRFTFKSAKVKASLYRTPDGKIQQFLLSGG